MFERFGPTICTESWTYHLALLVVDLRHLGRDPQEHLEPGLGDGLGRFPKVSAPRRGGLGEKVVD